jgi:hypothetical protein
MCLFKRCAAHEKHKMHAFCEAGHLVNKQFLGEKENGIFIINKKKYKKEKKNIMAMHSYAL